MPRYKQSAAAWSESGLGGMYGQQSCAGCRLTHSCGSHRAPLSKVRGLSALLTAGGLTCVQHCCTLGTPA